jgi:hypothetical protein
MQAGITISRYTVHRHQSVLHCCFYTHLLPRSGQGILVKVENLIDIVLGSDVGICVVLGDLLLLCSCFEVLSGQTSTKQR